MIAQGDEQRADCFSAPAWLLPVAAALLTIALFGQTLFVSAQVPCEAATDIQRQYLPWREFAFTQIRGGHFSLWNPCIFSGTPFFADPQSAMLYPPNWLHLIVSPTRAVNFLFAFHFFLAIYFTGWWSRRRGRSVIAAIVAGAVYACSGPIITNIRAGHLPLLCSAALAPLLFMCVDEILAAGKRFATRWLLLGIAAVAGLALDGFPQFACYSTLAAAIYLLLRWRDAKNRFRAATLLAIMFLGGWSIAAAQILASAQFAGESSRAGGLSLAAAGEFSLPPENLLTAIAPGVFGDRANLIYYGRWYWHETCIFVGGAALVLAFYGAMRKHASRVLLLMAALMIVLAMGQYTPLFKAFYTITPGFNSFRAPARFDLLAVLFLALTAGAGWDSFRELVAGSGIGRRREWALVTVALLVGISLASAAIWLRVDGEQNFFRLLHSLAATGQSWELAAPANPAFVKAAAAFAVGQLALAAATLLLTAGVFALAAKKRVRPSLAMSLISTLTVVPLLVFASSQRTSSDSATTLPHAWIDVLSKIPARSRVMLTGSDHSNAGYRDDFLNADGYDPLVLKRTAQFLALARNQPLADIGGQDPVQVSPSFARILGCTAILPGWPGGTPSLVSNPLPRLLLLGQYQVFAESQAALTAIVNGTFDAIHTVALESVPLPAPRAVVAAGSVHLLHETSDELEIEADLSAPRILLIDNAFSTGWHASPISATDNHVYAVLPADCCLQAIPLAAGHHHFLLVYRPHIFAVGKWISLIACCFYAIFGGLAAIASNRSSLKLPPPFGIVKKTSPPSLTPSLWPLCSVAKNFFS